MLILRCVHPRELPCPLPGARLNRSCLSCEASVPWWPRPSQAQGDTRRNNSGISQVSSSGVSSHSNYRSLPVHTFLDAPGVGGTDLYNLGAPSGRRVLAVLCPPYLCLSREECRILSCVRLAPSDPGPVLLELRSQGRGSRRQQGTTPPTRAPA